MASFCARRNKRRLLEASNSFGPVRPLVTVADDGSRWRVPVCAMAVMPRKRMGPPLRSFAADAHGCIMVRVLGPTGYKVVARLIRARKRAPSDRHPDRTSVPSCSKLSRCSLATAGHAVRLVRRPTLTASARAGVSEVRVGTKG